jgi:CheY-like chemotaxis protein
MLGIWALSFMPAVSQLLIGRRLKGLILSVTMQIKDGVGKMIGALIAVTAAAMACEIAGFSDYLTKPLDIANFYTVIDRYLSVVGKHKN